MLTRRIALTTIALIVTVSAHAQTKVKSGFNMFSAEQDVEIGRQSAAEVERQLPLVGDRSIDQFVNEVGEKLAAHAPGPRFDYQFRVVNASDLNAFALPGGPIYLNRGILESAKNEGEVAGVLAHEIAHIALRHGTHNASKAYLTQAGIGILGGILGGKVGNNTAQIINVLGGFGLNALFLKYSRDAETDADVIGAQILAKAGYNPADMAGFFRTLEKTEKRKTANWLSSHPAPARRIQRIEQEARLLKISPTPTQNTPQFASVQSELRGMPAARSTQELAQMTAPRQTGGGTQSGRTAVTQVATPSRQLRTYTSRARLFQLGVPSDWRVYEGDGHGVTLAPEGGVGTVNGGTEIVYGAVVNHYEPFGNVQSRRTNPTIEEATDDLIRQIQSSSPHLRVVRGSAQAFTLSGGRGLGVTLAGVSPRTRIRERVTLVTRKLADGHLIYMLFIVPDEDNARFNPALQAMVESFRVSDSGRH